MRLSGWLRAAVRPVLAIGACAVLAGLADEWALRTWQRAAAADETVARVVAFDGPVVAETSRSTEPHSRSHFRSQLAVVQPLLGPRAGELLTSRVLLGPNPSANLVLRRGMAVTVSLGEGTADARLMKPPLRYRWGLVAVLVLVATLVVAGGRVGLRVLLVMGGVAALLLGGLVPLLVRGWSPLPVTGLFCVVLLGAVFAISGAADRKALVAIAGCAAGLAVGALLLAGSGAWLGFSGTESVTARFLEWVEEQVGARYDYRGLAAASLLVALFGLAMDTSVTVAAGVAQVYAARPGLARSAARAAGMNIAGDVVGTMVLTLVFAFVGVQLPVLLMPHALGLSPAELLNSEAGASAVLHVLVGAVALAVTGPATAAIAPLLMAGRPAPAREPGRRRGRWTRVAAACLAVATLVGAVAWARLRGERPAAPRWSRPGAVAATLDRARGGLRQGQIGEALWLLLGARVGWPQEPRVRSELAYLCMSQRWLAQAEREIDAALAAGADDAQAHYVAGVVRAWTGRADEAEQHLRRALERDPAHAAARAAVDQLFGTSSNQESNP